MYSISVVESKTNRLSAFPYIHLVSNNLRVASAHKHTRRDGVVSFIEVVKFWENGRRTVFIWVDLVALFKGLGVVVDVYQATMIL